LIAINKSDLPQLLDPSGFARFKFTGKVGRVSAKTGGGLSWLKENLRGLLIDTAIEEPVVITNLRHRSALERSGISLRHARAALKENYASEFIAIDLNEAREALEEITGIIRNDDILERIFSNFCIGK